MKKKIRDFSLVTMGALITTIGFNSMFVSNHIASGGIGGLAVSFQELFDWPPARFVMIMNIPLLILCWFFLGSSVFIKTLYGSLIYPFFIGATSFIAPATNNQLLAAIFGGIIAGFGLGLVFLGNSSTGGTGILTQLIHKYTPLPLGLAMVCTDGLVVAISLVAFNPDTVMYSIISLIIISYVVDLMMAGFHASKNLMIISGKHEKIRSYITEKADRGLSQWPIVGGFTGEKQTLLMTTITNHEFPHIQKEILKIDPTAFILVMPASQVMGRGFSLTKHYQLADEDLLLPM